MSAAAGSPPLYIVLTFVPRRTVIIPGSDPPIEVVDDVTLHAAFNGINLNNGTTTNVLADGTDVGGNGPEYDTILHHDGSLLILSLIHI